MITVCIHVTHPNISVHEKCFIASCTETSHKVPPPLTCPPNLITNLTVYNSKLCHASTTSESMTAAQAYFLCNLKRE